MWGSSSKVPTTETSWVPFRAGCGELPSWELNPQTGISVLGCPPSSVASTRWLLLEGWAAGAGAQAALKPHCNLPSDPDLWPGAGLTPSWFGRSRGFQF